MATAAKHRWLWFEWKHELKGLIWIDYKKPILKILKECQRTLDNQNDELFKECQMVLWNENIIEIKSM